MAKKLADTTVKKLEAKAKPRQTHYILLVFQAACLAIIVKDATLLSGVLFRWINMDVMSWEFEAILVGTAILNILELMNNWASIKQYITYYKEIILFMLDIITLGVFYVQIDTLSKIVDDTAGIKDTERVMWFIVCCWMVLYCLYVYWNLEFLRSKKVTKEERLRIKKTLKYRIPQVVIGCFLLAILIALRCSSIIPARENEILTQVWYILNILYVATGGVILHKTQKLRQMLKIIMNAEEWKYTIS